MTQHTPPNNNRNIENPNSTYSNKTRGTHTRVSRVKVTTVGKPPFPEKQYRSCSRCKESTNSMKILTERVEKIEHLVDVLAKTTRGLASMKRDDRLQNNLKFRGLDLTRCSLQELQKLVVATTNFMASSSTKKFTSNPAPAPTPTTTTTNPTTNSNNKISPAKNTTLADITTSKNNEENEKKVLYLEPTAMEDVKTIPDVSSRVNNHQQPTSPIKSAVSSLKHNPPRQDSGYAEPDPIRPDRPEKAEKITRPSDNP